MLSLPRFIVDLAVDVDDLSTQDRRVLLVGNEDLGALIIGNLTESALVVLHLGSRQGLSGRNLHIHLALEAVNVLFGIFGRNSVADGLPVAGSDQMDFCRNEKKNSKMSATLSSI